MVKVVLVELLCRVSNIMRPNDPAPASIHTCLSSPVTCEPSACNPTASLPSLPSLLLSPARVKPHSLVHQGLPRRCLPSLSLDPLRSPRILFHPVSWYEYLLVLRHQGFLAGCLSFAFRSITTCNPSPSRLTATQAWPKSEGLPTDPQCEDEKDEVGNDPFGTEQSLSLSSSHWGLHRERF